MAYQLPYQKNRVRNLDGEGNQMEPDRMNVALTTDKHIHIRKEDRNKKKTDDFGIPLKWWFQKYQSSPLPVRIGGVMDAYNTKIVKGRGADCHTFAYFHGLM